MLLLTLSISAAALQATSADVQYLRPPQFVPQAYFGSSLATTGNRLVVATPGFRSRADARVGAVDLFMERAEGWRPSQRLVSPRIEGAASLGVALGFGNAVSMDGSRIAVTEPLGPPGELGRVYVYRETQPGTYGIEAVVDALDAPLQGLGDTVALDGERLVYGAVFAHGGRGSVHVVDRSTDGAWNRQTELWLPDSPQNSKLGESLDLEGAWIAAGAPRARTMGIDVGRAALFRENSSGGFDSFSIENPTAHLAASGQGGLAFGQCVAMSENGELAVSAPVGDCFVAVYELTSNGPELTGVIHSERGSRLGASMQWDGELLHVTSLETTAAGAFSAIDTYQRCRGSWQLARTVSTSSLSLTGSVGEPFVLTASGDLILGAPSHSPPQAATFTPFVGATAVWNSLSIPAIDDCRTVGTVRCVPSPSDCACSGVIDETGCPNSTGAGAALVALGMPRHALNQLRISGVNLPRGEPVLLISRFHFGTFLPAFAGDGISCIASPNAIEHYAEVRQSNQNGIVSWDESATATVLNPFQDRVAYQALYRDKASLCGSRWNATSALEIDVIR